eukprot:755102-Hanusia_phi.AAC.3
MSHHPEGVRDLPLVVTAQMVLLSLHLSRYQLQYPQRMLFCARTLIERSGFLFHILHRLASRSKFILMSDNTPCIQQHNEAI